METNSNNFLTLWIFKEKQEAIVMSKKTSKILQKYSKHSKGRIILNNQGLLYKYYLKDLHYALIEVIE